MRTTGLRTAPPSPAPRNSLVDETPAPALTPKTKETPGRSDKDLTKEHLNITLQVISQTIPPREGLAKELAGGKNITLITEQKSIATPSSTPPPKPPRTYSYISTPEKEDQSNSSHCITPPITPTALSLLKKVNRTVSDPEYSRSTAVIPKTLIRSVISSSDTVYNKTIAHNTYVTTPQPSIQSSNTTGPDQTSTIPVVTLSDNSLRRCSVAEDIPAPPSLTPSASLSSTANDFDPSLTEVPDCVIASPGASPSQSMATRPRTIRPSRQSSTSHERTSQSSNTQLSSTRPRQPMTLGEAPECRNQYATPERRSQGSTPERRTPGLTPESRTPSASSANGSRPNTAASQNPGYSSRPIDQGSITTSTEFEKTCKHIFQLNRNAKSFMDGNQYNKASAKYQLALSYIDKVLKTQVLEITSHEPTRQKYFQMQEAVFATRKECLNGFSDAQAAVVLPQELSTNSQPVGAPPSYQDVLQEDRLRTRGHPPPIPVRPPTLSRPQHPIHPTPAPAQSHHRHQSQVQPQPQTRLQSQPRPRPRPQPQPQPQHQPQPQLQFQPQPQTQFPPELQTPPPLQPRLHSNSRPVPQAQCNSENLTFSQPENHSQLQVSPQHQAQPKPQPRTLRQQSHPQPEHQPSPQVHSPAQPQPLPRSLHQPQPKPRTRRHHQPKALLQDQLQTPQQNQLQMPQQPQLPSRPEIQQQTEAQSLPHMEAQSQSTNQAQNKAQSLSQSKNPEQMKRPAYLCNHTQPIGDILHQVSTEKVRPVSLISERDGGKLSSLSSTKPLSETQTQQTKTKNLSFKPQIPGRMSMPIRMSHYHPDKTIHLPSRHFSLTDKSPEHQADSSQTFDNRSQYESTSQGTEKETQSHAHIGSFHNSNKEDLSELLYAKVIREKKPVRPPRPQKPLGDCKTKHVVSKTPSQQKPQDKINNSQITNMKKSIPSDENYSDISESSEPANSANSQSISIKSEIPNTFNSSLKVCTATDTKNTVVVDPFTSIDPFPSIEASSIQSGISLSEDNSVPSPVSLKKDTEIICESNSSNFNNKSSTKSNPLQTPIKPIHAPDVLLQPLRAGVEKNKKCEKNEPAKQPNNTSDFSTANLGDSILDALDVAIVQTHPKVSPQRSKEMSYFRCYSEETLLDYSYNTLGRYLESSQGLGNKEFNRCASRASIIEEFDPLVSLSPATSEKEIDEGETTLSPDIEENGSNSTLTPVDDEAVAESYYAVPRKLKWKSDDNSGNEKATSPPQEKEKVNKRAVLPKDLDANTSLEPSGNLCDADDYLASPYHIYAEVGTRSSIASSAGSAASWSSEFNKFPSYSSPTTPSTAGASDQDSWKPWNSSNQEDSEDDNTTDVGRSAFYRNVSSDQSSCGGSSPPVHNSTHSLSASATSTYRELFKIREGVKIFFIHNDGVVTSPWNKPFLSISEDPSKSWHGQSLLLRVGKSLWSCELVEKSTLVFKASSGTYFFKETNNKPECAAVGVRVPSSVRKVQHDLLDRLMQKHTRLETERPSGLTKSVSKGAESAATRVNKIVDNNKMEANPPFVRRNSMRALKGMSKRLASLAQWTGGTLPELPEEYESLQEASNTLNFCRTARTVQYI